MARWAPPVFRFDIRMTKETGGFEFEISALLMDLHGLVESSNMILLSFLNSKLESGFIQNSKVLDS